METVYINQLSTVASYNLESGASVTCKRVLIGEEFVIKNQSSHNAMLAINWSCDDDLLLVETLKVTLVPGAKLEFEPITSDCQLQILDVISLENLSETNLSVERQLPHSYLN